MKDLNRPAAICNAVHCLAVNPCSCAGQFGCIHVINNVQPPNVPSVSMRSVQPHLMMTLFRKGLLLSEVKKGLGSDRPLSLIKVASVTKPSP